MNLDVVFPVQETSRTETQLGYQNDLPDLTSCFVFSWLPLQSVSAHAVLVVKYFYHHPRSQAEKRHSINGSSSILLPCLPSSHITCSIQLIYICNLQKIYSCFPFEQLLAKCLLPAKEGKESIFLWVLFSLIGEMSTRSHSFTDVYQKSDSSS